MLKYTILFLFAFITLRFDAVLAQDSDHAKYVKPLIGTAGTGHTYPGATMPFGFVQLSPETGNIGWDYCSGYRYEDKSIMGFSHTHISGTGALALGDLLLMPFTGNEKKDSYRSSFSHDKESASPGYYAVYLNDYKIQAEMIATQRAGYHRYAFNSNDGHLLIDLKHGIVNNKKELETHVLKSELNIENHNTLSGYTITEGWAGEKHFYFVIKLDEPFVDSVWLSDPKVTRNQRLVLNFKSKNNLLINARVGISTVSIKNAKDNLKAEIGEQNFNSLKQQGYNKWEQYLSTVSIEADQAQKETFYTALYHLLVVPNNIADVNGEYRGVDNKVYTAKDHSYYSTFSLWDTYRAACPLYTILYPEKSNQFINTMLAHFDGKCYLPIWSLWGHENHCMIGNHSIPVIVDAYQKGIRNYDVEKAYQAIKQSSTVAHFNSEWDIYNKYGYFPSDLIKVQAVSKTLESCFDDWCVAQMAKVLNKTEDYKFFSKRAQFYKNVFDPSTKLMRGKRSDGQWVTPFEPFKISHAETVGGDFTEGNSWQYTWHVQHDINGLIKLMGGQKKFGIKLDSLFNFKPIVDGDGSTLDVTGLIGQYVHGNEPSHHVAYLYNYAGEPWKTQQKVALILSTLYDNTPGGLSGNDDCGQMSAWYIFSALGFYPVNPASGIYDLGSPKYKKAVLNVNGRKFIVETKNVNAKNIYIQRVELNGMAYKHNYIRHQDIVKGGHLTFIMGSTPVKN